MAEAVELLNRLGRSSLYEAEEEQCEGSAPGSELDDTEFLVEDGPEEEEPPAAQAPLDPKSDKTFVLPSMFKGRAPAVWMDYPAYMKLERQEGRENIVELTDKR